MATAVVQRVSAEEVAGTITREVCRQVIEKQATAWGLAGLRRVGGDEVTGLAGFEADKAEEINRWGNAAGLPPELPPKLEIC